MKKNLDDEIKDSIIYKKICLYRRKEEFMEDRIFFSEVEDINFPDDLFLY